MRERVLAARSRQLARRAETRALTNAELGDGAVRALVPVTGETKKALEKAVVRLGLSPRAYVRILKVARTIADLAGAVDVELPQVLEAVQYRSLDRRLT